MPRRALRDNLKKLHAELESVDELDAELASLLRRVAADIEKVLADEQAEETQPDRAHVEEIAVKFEAEHPRLARILGELADTLGKLGI